MKKVSMVLLLGLSLFVFASSPLIGTGKIIGNNGNVSILETSTGQYMIDGKYNVGQLVLTYSDDVNYINLVI